MNAQNWLADLRRALLYVAVFFGLLVVAGVITSLVNGFDPSRISGGQVAASWAFAIGGTWLVWRLRRRTDRIDRPRRR